MPVVSIEQNYKGMTSGVNINGKLRATGSERIHPYPWYGLVQCDEIEPLFVIDGVPVTSGNLQCGSGSEASMNNAKTNIMSTINPSDIENITVIKDAAAASFTVPVRPTVLS